WNEGLEKQAGKRAELARSEVAMQQKRLPLEMRISSDSADRPLPHHLQKLKQRRKSQHRPKRSTETTRTSRYQAGWAGKAWMERHRYRSKNNGKSSGVDKGKSKSMMGLDVVQ